METLKSPSIRPEENKKVREVVLTKNEATVFRLFNQAVHFLHPEWSASWAHIPESEAKAAMDGLVEKGLAVHPKDNPEYIRVTKSGLKARYTFPESQNPTSKHIA